MGMLLGEKWKSSSNHFISLLPSTYFHFHSGCDSKRHISLVGRRNECLAPKLRHTLIYYKQFSLALYPHAYVSKFPSQKAFPNVTCGPHYQKRGSPGSKNTCLLLGYVPQTKGVLLVTSQGVTKSS